MVKTLYSILHRSLDLTLIISLSTQFIISLHTKSDASPLETGVLHRFYYLLKVYRPRYVLILL